MMSRRKSLPTLHGRDDGVIMFRSRLLVDEKDGADLCTALDRMVRSHPRIGDAVIRMGGCGGASAYVNALDSLRTYESTGVAIVPLRP
jgi:hypothetical protein